jgi:hypothetical protein
MARPSTRQGLIDYCLRNLGHPVIEINVDEDQLEDRVDDALQFFAEYHFDGIERIMLKYVVTQDDINNGYISLTNSGTDRFFSQPGASGQAQDALAATEVGQTGTSSNIEDLIASVLQVFHFSHSTVNMWDIRYQYALNDLYTFGLGIDLTGYTITQSYLTMLRDILSPQKGIRFSRKTNKLYIDMKWQTNVEPGDYIVMECYRVLDPKVYPEIYNDMLLKQYVTALIKRQWGMNLSKFKGIQMPGGVTFNGDEIYKQADAEILRIQQTVKNNWELPSDMIMG